jgi:hypothetical protein
MGRASISVVVCGYTEARWGDLLAAVESARRQQMAPVEVLVVIDHNAALCGRLQGALREYGSSVEDRKTEFPAPNGEVPPVAPRPEVRVLASRFERGLSGARNTGIAEARGEIVAFLDDDAVACEDWLSWFADGFTAPEVRGVGGRTVPAWASGRRPRWYPEEFDWVHGASYRGMPSGTARVRNILGGNASFRRSALLAVGGFDTGLGRGADAQPDSDGAGADGVAGANGLRGRQVGRFGRVRRALGGGRSRMRPLGGEETELCIRVQQLDPEAVFLFENRAVIHHKVPPDRERFRYLVRRCWAEGLSKAQVAEQVGVAAGLATERHYVTRTLPLGVLRGLGRAARGDLAGAAMAAAIVAGVLVTSVAYAIGAIGARGGGRAAGVGSVGGDAAVLGGPAVPVDPSGAQGNHPAGEAR